MEKNTLKQYYLSDSFSIGNNIENILAITMTKTFRRLGCPNTTP